VVSEDARDGRVSFGLAVGSGRVLPWIADVALAPLARALAGTVVPNGASARREDHPGALTLSVEVALDTAAGWSSVGETIGSPARLLTPVPCAPCLFAAALDDRHAIVTRQDLGGSYVIDDTGQVRTARVWPAPILAEAPWTDGRAFAWSRQPARLLVRDAAGAITHDVALPFSPLSAEIDGEALRFTAVDGVWRWTGDGRSARLVATPPLVAALGETRRGLDLALVPPGWGTPRARTHTGLTWSDGDGLRERALSPPGPCWSRSTSENWTADAFPDANLVRVSHESTLKGWVICDYPRTVAWAGSSLIIVTTDGLVSFVPDLRRYLA
jgi:hypothetical protein